MPAHLSTVGLAVKVSALKYEHGTSEICTFYFGPHGVYVADCAPSFSSRT